MAEVTIRSATAADVPQILAFIRALAVYEKLEHQVSATESSLRATLFGPQPGAEVLIAEMAKTPVGFALFFHNYSTFLAQRGVYLEDLFVLPEWRNQGVGKRLLVELARLAVARGCGRFEWSVLDWNTPAIEFYKKLQAQPMSDWTTFRVTGEALVALAGSSAKRSE